MTQSLLPHGAGTPKAKAKERNSPPSRFVVVGGALLLMGLILCVFSEFLYPPASLIDCIAFALGPAITLSGLGLILYGGARAVLEELGRVKTPASEFANRPTLTWKSILLAVAVNLVAHPADIRYRNDSISAVKLAVISGVLLLPSIWVGTVGVIGVLKPGARDDFNDAWLLLLGGGIVALIATMLLLPALISLWRMKWPGKKAGTNEHWVNVRDKPAFLHRMMTELAGDSRISLEGDLSQSYFTDDVVFARKDSEILKRIETGDGLDFVLLRLTPKKLGSSSRR